MLDVTKLEANYEESIILNNVNLQVSKGQVVCLLGRNGVGKTTFLKSIMGLVRTPKGSIKFNGREIIAEPTYFRARQGISYVPQGRDIFPQLSVQENLLLGLEALGGKGSIDETVYDLFPVLKTMLQRKGGDLSGGQQQQLAIARALVAKPKLLILDEPTEGIQPSVIQEIGRVIKQLRQAEGLTILIVEQYLDFAVEVSDYYYVMEKGRIEAKGFTREINKEEIQKLLAI
ncbi:high-affinity branched-chain amino acid transport ATP-binding protein LivF [Desulfosporosinus acididurans]|uniref:High-affinity branched-chain amino acid transport ATP-binding protein LivF n=1 Tax=Desulfosporosinus acididurans TaxID=476652 RepID=A0A0J1FSI2_9FIRM|nr:urea ABC transporter ATP-binding subunit UrtE [Desulfosporosinus acididurans]KLU65938.1 high-affinity branched-chain amino acid transport ATP-binding protein LivF [Desulfosporosinus acididurans]